jgi:hypothetical protein
MFMISPIIFLAFYMGLNIDHLDSFKTENLTATTIHHALAAAAAL